MPDQDLDEAIDTQSRSTVGTIAAIEVHVLESASLRKTSREEIGAQRKGGFSRRKLRQAGPLDQNRLGRLVDFADTTTSSSPQHFLDSRLSREHYPGLLRCRAPVVDDEATRGASQWPRLNG
jgi:hypothetical protein